VADGSSLLIFTFRPTGVDDAEELPSGFSLAQNYPNPFNPSTTIEYQLPEAAQVNIDIFDINGRKVTALADEYKAPGEYSVSWNAPENESGVYFYRIQADKYTNTKSCILLK